MCPDGSPRYSFPINRLSLLYRCSHHSFPCFGIRQTQSPHRTCTPAIIYTAPPNSSPLLTIFYIFYRPTPRTLRILLFSEFLFQTVQNVDASFLNSVPVLSLLCSPPLRSLVRPSRAECTFSPVPGPFLSSLSSLWFPHHKPRFTPYPLFSSPRVGTRSGDCSIRFFSLSFHRLSITVPPP